MAKWLENALGYADQWLGFQMRLSRQPGCVIAVAHKERLVFERAYGFANAVTGERLTPRHRFRVASHSKSFTAAAVLLLRESGKLSLDDAVGRYVEGLHPSIAAATLAQLLSHGAGVIRDGADAGQWIDERPFANEAELREALIEPPLITPNTRMKYSNHGFGLLGLVIEKVTGERYGDWIGHNILAAPKLTETKPDGPFDNQAPVARGHSAELPLGRRVIIPGDNPANALAPATGFVSTAADLVRFFSSLDPDSKHSVLSPASRRAMLHRQWRNPHSTVEGYYGLGLCLGSAGGWEWAGHGGGFQSAKTFTAMLPGRELCLSVLTNAIDGMAEKWSDGLMNILRTFATNSVAKARTGAWKGRWWSLGDVVDLVPFGERVLIASPDQLDPFAAADEIRVTAKDLGVISLSGGYGIHGEIARLVRGGDGSVREVWLGGDQWISERRMVARMKRKYDP